MNRKAEILYRLGEPLAAGMFGNENSSIVERCGLGLRRYFEHAAPPARSSGYSEHYSRLPRDLQLEVLKRTEHMV